MIHNKKERKICLISSVPMTLWAFYRGLIKQLDKEYGKVVLISSNQPELKLLQMESHVSIFGIDLPRRISPICDLISFLKMWRIFRREKFNIVHAHTPKGGFIGISASFCAGVPNRVYTIHGSLLSTATTLKRKLLWIIEWLTCRLASQVLVVSPSLLRLIVDEKLCSPGKMQVLGNGTACGVDVNYFNRSANWETLRKQMREKFNIPPDAVVIGFVGRVVPDKGIKTLVEAFEKLQNFSPGTWLFLVGEFETIRESLDEKTMHIIKTNKNIRYNGEFVCDVLPYYSAIDIITLPTKHEGFGMTLLEAAALGLPTVASRVTGCVDAVADNVTGLLVEAENVEQLSDALRLLVSDSAMRNKLGQQGRERVQRSFDSEFLINKHIDFYESLFSKNGI